MFGLPCGRWSNTNIGSFHYIVFALKNAELYSVIFCIASPHMPLRAKPKYSILLYKWAYTALWLQSCDVVCAESSRRYESLDKKIIISWKKTVTFVNLLFRYRTEKNRITPVERDKHTKMYNVNPIYTKIRQNLTSKDSPRTEKNV